MGSYGNLKIWYLPKCITNLFLMHELEKLYHITWDGALCGAHPQVSSGLGLILGGTLFYARVTFKTLVVFNFKVP